MLHIPTVDRIDELRRRGASFLGDLVATVRVIERLASPVIQLVREFVAYKAHFLAAAIAFYTFLSLLPLTIAMITVIHLTIGEGEFHELLHDAILTQIPVLSEAASGPSFVEDFITHAVTNSALTSGLGGLVLFISTLGVFSAVRQSINIVWGIERRRGFFMQRVVEVALMMIASLLLLTSFVVFTVFSFLEEIAVFFAFDTATIRYSLFEIVGIVLPWAITYTVLTFIYAWVPNTKTHIKAILPVALVATVAFEVVKHVFAVYLQLNAGHLLSIYGSLAALMMFFIFVYVEAIIVLAGAMLCAKWTEYLKTRNQQRLFDPQEFRMRRFAARIRLIRGAKP